MCSTSKFCLVSLINLLVKDKLVLDDVVAGHLGQEDRGVPADMSRAVLTHLHILHLHLVHRDLLAHHLLALVTDLRLSGGRPLPVVTVTVVT